MYFAHTYAKKVRFVPVFDYVKTNAEASNANTLPMPFSAG